MALRGAFEGWLNDIMPEASKQEKPWHRPVSRGYNIPVSDRIAAATVSSTLRVDEKRLEPKCLPLI